jgi:NAD+ kinase
MRISKIGIIAHRRVKPALARKVIRKLSEKGIEMFFDPITAEKIKKKGTDVKEMHVDLAVIAGGDGTILWAASELPGNTPILGIKAGKIGHLAELTLEKFNTKADLLLKGKFFIDERMKLRIDKKFDVLNEAFILSKQASLLEFRIDLNGREVADFRADGVIVSTPTGSTGHSLSSGGAILHPGLGAYIITPVNPFLREHAPLVVPEDHVTGIELTRPDRDAQLIIDGRFVKDIKPHQAISIKKSGKTARFVRFSEDFSYNYVDVKRRR